MTSLDPKGCAAFMLWEATHMRWQQLREHDTRSSATISSALLSPLTAQALEAGRQARDAYVRCARAGDVARKNAPTAITKLLRHLDFPYAAHES